MSKNKTYKFKKSTKVISLILYPLADILFIYVMLDSVSKEKEMLLRYILYFCFGFLITVSFYALIIIFSTRFIIKKDSFVRENLFMTNEVKFDEVKYYKSQASLKIPSIVNLKLYSKNKKPLLTVYNRLENFKDIADFIGNRYKKM